VVRVGTRWRSWLGHCATSRKVAGSFPDGVIGNFHWHNPSGRTVALRSTQPLTEMSTRNFLGVGRPVRMADNLTTFMCRLSWNLGASKSCNPMGLLRPVHGWFYLTGGSHIWNKGTTVILANALRCATEGSWICARLRIVTILSL